MADSEGNAGDDQQRNCGQWLLARKPVASAPQDEDFRWQSLPLPEPDDGQLLSRTIYLSMDPYQWVRRRSGTEAVGDVCHGRTVSQVVASRLPGFAEGDYLFNTNGWSEYGLTGRDISHFGYMHPRKLDAAAAPLSTAIGVLGMLGLTAYAGLIVQCQPQAGETVVVSAASGGVGQVVGQLARLRGCRVVGIAGAPEKCAFVTEALGFDACVSHLAEDLPQQLAAACPDGCDVYFENVGGLTFAAVLPLLNQRARISLCGIISQYGAGGDPRQAWRDQGEAVFSAREVQVHDLFVGNFVDDYQDQFLAEMGDYVRSNQVQYREHRWEGLRQAPAAFRAMLKGGNFGKSIVQVGAE
ncbi:MAG: NADP-dependent oxidoreductase [Pseudomonadota bacterium]